MSDSATATTAIAESEVPSRYRGLRPWKPGQSGNPSGRPKGLRSIREELERDDPRIVEELKAIAYVDPEDPDPRTSFRLRFKYDALKLLAAYRYGPPGPVPEDLTVRDVLMNMTVDAAKQLVDGKVPDGEG